MRGQFIDFLKLNYINELHCLKLVGEKNELTSHKKLI